MTGTKRRVEVLCLTYGEPEENLFWPQFQYSLSILNRLTRRVAPIPKFVTPLLAARRGLIRARTFREKNWNSPLEKISERQAEVLGELLSEMRPECDFNVRVLREFRPPYLPEVLATLEETPPDDLLIIPLYVAESDFTTGISRTDFETFHRSRNGGHSLPGPKYALGFGFDERFAKAMADFIMRYCESHGWTGEKLRESALILGAHGTVVTLPPGMNSGAQETGNLFRLVRRELKDRFGWVRVGWLNHELGGMWTCPSVETSALEAQKRGFRKVVYFPFGFVGDNGESMVEGRDQLAVAEWEEMLYLECPNEDRDFLRAMAEIAAERLNDAPEDWEHVGRGNAIYERPEMPAEPGTPGQLKANGPALAALAGIFWTVLGAWLTFRAVEAFLLIEAGPAFAIPLGVGLLVAWYKGTRILGPLAMKNLKRLRRIPQPSPLYAMFSRGSWILAAFFAGVGIAMRVMPLAPGVRAAILLGVGLAMLTGAAYYVRHFHESRPLTETPPARSGMEEPAKT